MTVEEARAMIEPAGGWGGAGEIWADLGCGRGTFTLALADLLGPDGRIFAVDTSRSALRALPSFRAKSLIEARHEAMQTFSPDVPLDGVLMANVLHYDGEPEVVLSHLTRLLRPGGRLLLVEYDTDQPAPPWVPHPISRRRAHTLLAAAGFTTIRDLASRPSRFRRADLYSVSGRNK